jgi:hypothetical protein
MPNDLRPELAKGQAWSFKGAPAPNARVIIGAIDSIEAGDVVHLALVDLPSPRELATERDVIAITHMPFDRAAVEASIDRLLGEEAPPDSFDQGFARWSVERARGEAFVFTVSLLEAVESLYGRADEPSAPTVH